MIKRNKLTILLLFFLLKFSVSFAQVDTLFWFAAPWVTPDHTFRDNIVVHLAGVAGTSVTIRQPAAILPNKYDTVLVLPASGAIDYQFWRDKFATATNVGYDSLECKPANTVLPYGLKISSTSTITAVYDVVTRAASFLNPETYSLKGQNGLGREFVCPFQTRWNSQTLPGDVNGDGIIAHPRQQINIVATRSNTTIWITPKTNIVGHLANITFSVYLANAGDCYTAENLVGNTTVAGNNLSGTIVTANEDIAVTVSDDSVSGATGCYDLMGDQIVPVDIVGKEYIVIGGKMNGGEPEGAYIVATENFTQVDINNGAPQVPVMMNKGDSYYFPVPTGTLTYIVATKNVYVLHGTGFGCELGEALLPPMDCGGSNNIRFTRNNTQRYFLNVLCRSGLEGNFILTVPGTGSLIATDFTVVPGTGGTYVAAQKEFNLGHIAVSTSVTANQLSNNTSTNSVFSLGIYNGDLSTGNMYHYMSLFFRKTLISTSSITPICFGETPTVALSGTISGGVTNGYWTVVSGNGSLSPGLGTSAVYTVDPADGALDTLRFRLISNKNCKGDSVMQVVKMLLKKTPVITVGTGTVMCKNNIFPVILTGSVAYGSGSWSGGNGGSFGVPGPNTTYTPSLADLAANTITLTLTGTSTLGCLPTATTVTVGFTNPPIPNPGANTIVCTNSSTLELNGTIPGGGGGIWNSSGTGLFFPNNAILNPTYNLSVGDLTLTTIVFSLTSIPIPSTNCAGETRTMVVSVIPKPVVDAGPDRIACASSSIVILNGSVSGAATTGSWSTTNGSGTFPPPNGVPTATYLLGPGDITTGTVVVVLNSTPGTCPTAADTANLFIVTDPVITVNSNTTVCNNAQVPCTGTITGAVNSGFWTASPGGGVFSPTNNLLGVLYTPSAADLAAGTIVISLHPDATACGNGPAKSFTVTVINSPKALFNFPVYGRCLGSGVAYTDASLPNGSSSLNYNWNFGESATSISTATNPIYTYTNSGSYLVTLTVTGNNSCFDTLTRRVSIAPNPISEFSVVSSCQGINSVFLSTSQAPSGGGAINALIWEWNDLTPNTVVSGANFTNTATHIYTAASQYIAVLTASTTLGCTHSSTQAVNISPQPNAEFGMTNNPNVAQEPVYFSDFSTPNGGNFSYYWQFGDEATASEQGPTHIYQNAGVYVIKLTITDAKGCSDTISKSIDINLLPQVPTAFTPNGDNNNDLLFLKGGPFEKMKFRVYNNWGELLFETTDQKIGWDGKKNGVEQPLGVYVWTLEVDMYNNRQVKKNGDVTLIR